MHGNPCFLLSFKENSQNVLFASPAGTQLVAVALFPVTTDSSPITVGEGVEDPTMEGMGTWATGTKTGLEAMPEDRIGGTKVRHAATPSHCISLFG